MLRRLIPRRATAVVATGVLAVAGAVVLSAPAAQAAEVTYTSACTNDFLGPVGDTLTKIDLQVSPVKDKYAVGEAVTLTWKWLAYNNVPEVSPLPSVPANTTKPFGDITVEGAQSGIASVEGPQEHPEALKGQPLIVADMTGTLVLTSPGVVTLAPKQYRTVTNYIATSVTSCVPAAGQVPGVGATLTVEGGAIDPAVLNAPDEPVHPGWEVPLTGTKFVPNSTPTVALCAADGSGCDETKFTGNSLVIDGQGNLSGTATLKGTGVAAGSYQVKVTGGTQVATDTVTVALYTPPEERSAEITPSSGPVGTTVTITGKGWTPNASVNVVGLTETDIIAGTTQQLSVDPRGNLSGQYTVTEEQTAKIRIREGISSTRRVIVPFTVTPGGAQPVNVTLNPGGLTMTQAGTGIDFGTATMNGSAQTLTANLNQVTVVDARGGNAGWSLVGSMSDLTAPGGTIPATSLSWTPSCAKSAGSLSDVTPGSPGPITGASLCQQAADASATTGGRFTADAQLTLTTPEFAAAGSYTGTLTLTLS